jgi:hypothetical protein
MTNPKTKPKATVTAIPTAEPSPKQPLPASLQAQIEQQWLGRAKTQNMPSPASMTYKRAECEFFVGAMAALDACGYTPPMKWVMSVMSNGNVVQP